METASRVKTELKDNKNLLGFELKESFMLKKHKSIFISSRPWLELSSLCLWQGYINILAGIVITHTCLGIHVNSALKSLRSTTDMRLIKEWDPTGISPLPELSWTWEHYFHALPCNLQGSHKTKNFLSVRPTNVSPQTDIFSCTEPYPISSVLPADEAEE